jgi:hypothetical protein
MSQACGNRQVQKEHNCLFAAKKQEKFSTLPFIPLPSNTSCELSVVITTLLPVIEGDEADMVT